MTIPNAPRTTQLHRHAKASWPHAAARRHHYKPARACFAAYLTEAARGNEVLYSYAIPASASSTRKVDSAVSPNPNQDSNPKAESDILVHAHGGYVDIVLHSVKIMLPAPCFNTGLHVANQQSSITGLSGACQFGQSDRWI